MKKSLLVLFCIMCFCITGCGYKKENVDVEYVSGDLNGVSEEIISGSDTDVVTMDKEVEDSNTGKNVTIISKIESELESDWYLELNKYPLEKKILCYDGEYNQGDEKNSLKIYFLGYDYLDYTESRYEIIINDVVVDEIYADDIYIVDLENNDEYIEIVANDYWENGVNSDIYRYTNNELICVGDDVTENAEQWINYDGKYVSSYEDYHFFEGILIPRYYVLENGQFVQKFTKYSEVRDRTYTVTQEVLNEIECYDKLQIGDKIKILSITDESDNITTGAQGVIMRVINEKGEIFEIGHIGSWA